MEGSTKTHYNHTDTEKCVGDGDISNDNTDKDKAASNESQRFSENFSLLSLHLLLGLGQVL